MARIRSIHPGFFSDEVIVTLSFPARLLLIGLLTECDDGGVFDWKPVTIKIRLFPVDNIDISSLLEELISAGTLRKEEVDGHKVGLVRNFAKFQRPRKPNYRFVIPSELRTYVGLNADGTEPEHAHVIGVTERKRSKHTECRTKAALTTSSTELIAQMKGKDGVEGGRKKKERKKEEDTPSGVSSSKNSIKSGGGGNGAYAFKAGCIKLTAEKLEQWRKAFPNLSLESELTGLAEWAGKQKNNWFHAVTGALAKRQRETVLAIERMRIEAATKGEEKPPSPIF